MDPVALDGTEDGRGDGKRRARLPSFKREVTRLLG